MGLTEVIDPSKLYSFQVWDRVVNTDGIHGTVFIACKLASKMVYVKLDAGNATDVSTVHVYDRNDVTKFEEGAKALSYSLLCQTNYDFGMSTFDITTKDGTVVKCCYLKNDKFLQVAHPHRQLGLWDIDTLLPSINKNG